jgi:hypothetical protein
MTNGSTFRSRERKMHTYIAAVQEWGKVFVDGNRRGLKREE